MKTISGKLISTKHISFSKAAKILSKFVSAENGASQVIRAYLHRASSSFNELNQLHKEIKSPHPDRKHKRSRSKIRNFRVEGNSIQNVEMNQVLNQGAVHQFGSENTGEDEENSAQTIVMCNHVPDEAIKYQVGNGVGSERHKKKKKEHNVKLLEQGDNGFEIGGREGEQKPVTGAGNKNEEKSTRKALDFNQEPVEREKHNKKKKREDEFKKHVANEVKFEEGSHEGNAGDDNTGLEERKKHKREKKKKDKDHMNNSSINEGDVEPKDESAKRTNDQKEILSNGLEEKNGGSVDQQEFESKKKKRNKKGSEDIINTDEVKMVQKKRKNKGRDEDRSEEPTKKIKRK